MPKVASVPHQQEVYDYINVTTRNLSVIVDKVKHRRDTLNFKVGSLVYIL